MTDRKPRVLRHLTDIELEQLIDRAAGARCAELAARVGALEGRAPPPAPASSSSAGGGGGGPRLFGKLRALLTGVALAFALILPSVAQPPYYPFFPVPGISYTQSGGMSLGSATGGVQGAGTLNTQGLFVNGVAVSTSSCSTGSFTLTLGTGFTAGSSGTMNYAVCGEFVSIWLSANLAGTSNATSFQTTGAPTAIQPAHQKDCPLSSQFENSNAGATAQLEILAASGTWAAAIVTTGSSGSSPLANGAGWTASSGKGFASGFSCVYSLD